MTKIQTHDRQPIPGVKETVAVSSGKGGVGKSTASVNIAVALAASGRRVGLMDTDIYGPNVPGMLGVEGRPQVEKSSQRIQPLEAHGVRAISMGLLVEAGVPVIWRGPMLAKMVGQFLFQVAWGELDVLLLDLPPGTGDVQITLTQSAPLTGSVIVTTPSTLALEDVRRGVEMFRQSEVPILGLLENMGSFVCPACEGESHPFGEGGGQQTADSFDLPLLGSVPLDPQVRLGADGGTPVVQQHPESAAAVAFRTAAERIIERLDP
ncbi:MAG: Mrp/NBP35 family ATP-binding protein [Candidatus Latescibacterota bacterium]|nr:Mrp/NBP35 family ATP-binding protein [Candidatus Latescibacterota bacterium]